MSDSPEKEAPQETIEDEQRKNLELKLQLTQKWRKSMALKALIAFISAFSSWLIVTILVGFDFTDMSKGIVGITVFIIVGIFIGCVLAVYINLFFDFSENAIRSQILDFEIDRIQNETEEDIFENSIKMSYKYLDQYYFQTREHAQRGFWVSMFVSVCGAILIGIGIIAMFLDRVTPSYITCASGVITEFIASIFFYLYNKTVSSMSNYHNKLVLSQNVSIALKVAESLPEDERVNAKKTIINELLKDINTHLVKEDVKSETKST